MHSTSDEQSDLHHMRVLVIHLKQFTSICITFTLLDKQKEVYWQNPENLFFRGGHFWRAKSKTMAKTF